MKVYRMSDDMEHVCECINVEANVLEHSWKTGVFLNESVKNLQMETPLFKDGVNESSGDCGCSRKW